MWLVAKNSSLLSPNLTLIILHIALRNLRVLGSIGPRTSIHIGKNSIEGRAFPYFFIFSSAALAAAKPHSLLVRSSIYFKLFQLCFETSQSWTFDLTPNDPLTTLSQACCDIS
ncbi:hypothetical protein HELRODRAFT_173408 [Helobdella robusta]|uniref:Uncharacterized protein n=1 Tax=Helobdella robusta TaxID=6412 RepID=T1F6S4_HELRO|nr:hypothetical protein HELRODRAFT_173408 [Helobdella robusta]ESO03707.1 hypothetical protein HELRODRAFT_173408 [Helobdella robusta]